MDLLTFLMQSTEFPNKKSAESFAAHWGVKKVPKGTQITRQGETDSNEFIILDGCITSRIYDHEGNEVCVGLYVGAAIISPNIARSHAGKSRATIEAVSDTVIAHLDSETLTNLMISSEQIRAWANGILSEELSNKADREWCLAALGGADRLAWFRKAYPNYEDIFAHALIASFLGITPVTLSRLRRKNNHKHP